MTVCTNHVACGDLVEHRLPVVVAETPSDVEVLTTEMVELKDERVGLAAVNARPFTEELDEIGGALCDERLFSAYGVRDVALAVRRIVLLFIGCPAGTTIVVPLTALLSPPGEVRDRHDLLTAPAGLSRVRGLAWHEHMFSYGADGACIALTVESRKPRGVAQSGSAPGWGPGGRRFKSCLPDTRKCLLISGF